MITFRNPPNAASAARFRLFPFRTIPFRIPSHWSCLVAGVTEQTLENGFGWAITRIVTGA